MSTNAGRHEFTASEVVELLAELDRRLRRRGVSASAFVVGGAAVAVAGIRGDRLTEDVDVITDGQVMLEEAALVARERGLPDNWLNPNARMWMPPLPGGVLDHPDTPGLRVTYADDGFLFATKLIAQRAKDAADVVALARRLKMQGRAPRSSSRTSGATTPMKRPWSSSSTAMTLKARSATSLRMPPGC